MKKIIEMHDITKEYNSSKHSLLALSDINLSIYEGEFVGILGSSGSGKTTLMNILGLLDKQTKGQYILNKISTDNLKDKELSKLRANTIGFVFQSFNLIPDLTVLENVMLPLSFKKIEKSKRKDLAESALYKVGLSERKNHYPSEISGGQSQRAAIARAIALAPPIILADEPTGNLDPKSSSQVEQIFKDLNKEGKTIILITHDKEIAKRIPRTEIIKDGVLI